MRASGGIRPSKTLSLLAAVVGIGMAITVALFFVAPVIGIAAFVVLWICTVLGIVGYHLRNAFSREGVNTARVDFHVEPDARDDFETRLRQRERLRQDGLLTDAEYQQKRADILNENW